MDRDPRQASPRETQEEESHAPRDTLGKGSSSCRSENAVTRRPHPPRIETRQRKGRCYELAGRGQLNVDPTWTLVHGRAAIVARLPLLIAHAWLEKDGYVYDASLDELMTAKKYVARYKALTERRYSAAQTAKKLIENEHWGPWHLIHDITVVGDPVRREIAAVIARRKHAMKLRGRT